MDPTTVDAVSTLSRTPWGAALVAAMIVVGMLTKLVTPAQSAIRDWMLGQRRTAAEIREHDTAQLQGEIARLASLVGTLQETIDAMQRRERARDKAIIRHIQWDHQMIQDAIAHGRPVEEPPNLWGEPADNNNTNGAKP